MKKPVAIVLILLLITLGLLWHTKRIINVDASITNTIIKNENLANNVKIIFLDVGQGDASLIKFANGEKMLVDCGIDTRILEALDRAVPYYDKQIDYLVVTHPDLDHYGGCIDVLNRFEVKNIILNGMKKSSDKAWQWFEESVKKSGAKIWEINQELVWQIASSTVDFIYPNKPVKDLIKTDLYKNYNGNNLSIVFILNFLGHQILFTGDAEIDLEKYLINIYNSKLESEVLKVGHHGSSNSSVKDFLNIVKPKFSIISVGQENKFGHPTERVLKKLERTGGEILRTDKAGDITCEIAEQVVCSGAK